MQKAAEELYFNYGRDAGNALRSWPIAFFSPSLSN